MALQTNRLNSLISSGKKTKTVSEYLAPLLAANVPLKDIEKNLVEEVTELENKLKATTDDLEKSKIEFALKNRKTIINALQKEKEIESAVNVYNDVNKKLEQEYLNTTKRCEELFDYIINIDIEHEKDLTKLKNAIQDKITAFTAQLIIIANQKDALQQAFKTIEDLNPRYAVIEACTKKAAKFKAKTYEWVKAQYVASLKKIQELEEAKAKIGYAHEKKQIDAIIEQIKKSITEDLAQMLENPKDIDAIKVEAYKELGVDLTDPQTQHERPVVQTEQSGKSEGESDVQAEPTEEVERKTIVTRTPESKDSEDFKKAKSEYLNIISLINSNIERLEELNTQQDMYTFNPEENLENMVKNYEDIETINKRINELKRKKLELEYDKYVDEHIILTLDNEVKNAQIKKIEHSSDLIAFMEQHNEVIKYCYEQLQTIATQDYSNNPDLQAKIKQYKEIISIQHLIINERLVEERKNNKDFDAIKFMREHRVQMTTVQAAKKEEVVEPKTVVENHETPNVLPKPTVEEYDKDNMTIVNEIKKLIDEYKNDFILLYAQLKNIESEIGYDDLNRQTLVDAENKIHAEATRMRTVITDKITTSGLSKKRQDELLETLTKTTQMVTKAVDNKLNTPTHFRLVELKKDIEVLLRQSQELIRLSEISMSSEEYKKALEKFNNNVSFLESKYIDLELKVASQSASSVKIEYKVDKTNKKGCVIATKSKKAKQEVVENDVTKKRVKTTIKENKLDFNGKVVEADRKNALIATVSKVKITLLTQKLKIEYTKQLVEDLKKLKVNLEIKASAENKSKINVSQAKDSKDQKREYRYIDDIENLSSAQVIYRDQETGEEILNYELLGDPEIQTELENRRKLK